MDQEVGSNPFWHSCLLLSQWDEMGGKMEVVDHWGFYGMPTTTLSNSWLGKLKIKIGLDVDLKGNHGMLRHEEVRFLDLGRGLHGVTYELTQEKFTLLQQKCVNMADEQEKAIKEIVEPLGLKGKPPEEARIHPYEQWSSQIFALEKARAEQQNRPSRLKPFELNLSLTLWGPALNQSFTCKSQVLSLLEGVLSLEQINRLTENGKHPTIPRYSGNMERIFLHSSGSLREHKKHSGTKVYYRDAKDMDVKLHWTLPPQKIEALSDNTMKQLLLVNEYCDEVKSIIAKLQGLEWLFRNAQLPAKYQSYQMDLITYIHECYEAFATIEPKKAKSSISGWHGYALSLFFLPRDEDECHLQQKIKQAKNLFNSLYMAIVDGWEIDGDCLAETQEPNITTSNEDLYYNPPEALASYLTVEDKRRLCSLIGRAYLELTAAHLTSR